MQKKIMTLWQMIILVVLLAAVTISMFFPVLNPTGKKEVKYRESFMEKYQDDEKFGKNLKDWEDDDTRQKKLMTLTTSIKIVIQ